ncbi:MAG: inositol monophosphatase family protein [Nitrososphaeria archaeon]|nr:inositol monophosphatase family protein [Nitrososphaeria archaeon]
MLTEIIREALLEARRVLSECLSKGLVNVEGRGWSGDYSRQFDILTEKAIINVIKNNLDKVYIVSEEVGEIPCKDPDFYVLIDPVDGSTNVSQGLPFSASAITVSKSPRMDDIIAAGVIDHQTGKLYLGDRDRGVMVMGNPPSMRRNISLKDALVFIDLSIIKENEKDTKLVEWCVKMITKSGNSRFFAAANLEISYILEGKADAYACLSRDLKVLDFCAPATMVRWAGGEYRLINGNEEMLLTKNGRFGIIVASTKNLLEEILSLRITT